MAAVNEMKNEIKCECTFRRIANFLRVQMDNNSSIAAMEKRRAGEECKSSRQRPNKERARGLHFSSLAGFPRSLPDPRARSVFIGPRVLSAREAARGERKHERTIPVRSAFYLSR